MTKCTTEQLKMLGYSHEDFLGKKLWEIGPFSDIAASRLRFSELQTKGYVRYEHLPLETRDGHLIDVEFVSNVYLVDQKKIIQCNVRDITLRKQAEEALRKAYDEMDLRVKGRTAELTRANERLSQEIEGRKQAAISLREALTIIKQLKDQLHEENIYLKDFDVDPGWRGYYRDRNWHGHRWDYERIPHERLHSNWKNWDNNRYWERQRTWGV